MIQGAKYGWRALRFRVSELTRTLGWRLPWTTLCWMARPKYLVLARDLRLPLPEPGARLVTSESVLTEADITAIWAINSLMTPAEVRRRLADGQICRLEWIGSAMVHYRWEVTRPTYLPYVGRTFNPHPGQLLGNEVFTASAFRGRGIHASSTIATLHRMQSEGFRQTLAIVACWNEAVTSASLEWWASGVVGSIGYWNPGVWRRYFSEGAVRFDSPTSFCIDV